MADRVKRIPKKGDRVAALGQEGAFVVSDVDSERWTAELKLIGPVEFTLKDIPWGVLTFLDELDESQNAARIVREATEDH